MKTRDLRLMAIGLGGLALVVGARAGDSRQSSVTIDAPAEVGDVTTSEGSTGPASAGGVATPGAVGAVSADSIRRLDFAEIDQPRDVCAQGIGQDADQSLEMITLSGGESDVIDEDMFSRLQVNADSIAYGDINGDGIEEAVVHTICEFGANGRQNTIEVWGMGGGVPGVASTVPAPADDVTGPFPGDVKSFAIQDGVLEVVWTGYAEGDPNCCPSNEVTVRYQLVGNEMLQLGEPQVVAAQ